MTNKARIVDNVAIDVTDGDPVLQFGPELGAQFVTVPNKVQPQWRRIGTAWFPPPEPSPPSLETVLSARKSQMLAALADKRWQVETGGVTVEGALIRTDAGSQAKLTGAVTLASNDQTQTTIDWEAQPGVWVTLDAPTVVAMGITVGRFVQACFSRARVLSEQITAASTHAALDAIDLNAGWPS